MRNLGRPVELANRYFEEGADEITFLNITGADKFPLYVKNAHYLQLNR